MKICVLGGSPKGDISVTMQYIAFLTCSMPEAAFDIHQVCRSIKRIEEDPQLFERIIQSVRDADLTIWAFPLYVMLVHGSYKRFIELIFERCPDALNGKYAVSLCTSINFYDDTALNYMHAVSDDLGMQYIGSYSAKMQDLLRAKERSRLLSWIERHVMPTILQHRPTQRRFAPYGLNTLSYISQTQPQHIDRQNKRIAVLCDGRQSSPQLSHMVDHFSSCFGHMVEVIDLEDIAIKGGCLGCLHCGYDNVCVYDDKDEVRALYERLTTFDIIVYALTIKDRYFSSRYKTFVDRRFYKTHQPIFTGKQIGYLVSGPLNQNENLQNMMAAMAQFDEANLFGVVSDECSHSKTLDTLIETFAHDAVTAASAAFVKPKTFWGVSGQKIFRDEIWGGLRFPFRGDHRAYKKSGMYDFPQRKVLQVAAVSLLTSVLYPLPPFKKKVQSDMRTLMIERLKKAAEGK